MKIQRLITSIIILFLILAAATYMLLRHNQPNPIDVPQINDAIKTAEEYIGADMNGAFSQKEYGFKFTVLDANGAVLYRNDNQAAITSYDAIASGGSAISFRGGMFLLTSDFSGIMTSIQNTVLLCALCVLLLSALLCAAYVVYLDRKIIRPFWKMRTFARNVAGGNFDIPLEMDRDNLFGAFTESFDLMRTELKLAKENERVASQSKKELVASLSHDIKTPLASIKALTELLEISKCDADQHQKLKTIDQKIEQISLLTNNLFHATLEELCELSVSVIEHESHVLEKLLRTADYEGRLTICHIVEAIIDCDPLRTQQVFDNIFGNSYKYAGTDINVDSSVESGFLLLTIRDSGGGVPESELPLITHKFYRGTNAAQKSGSGLGLYMCNYFMTQMGGHMEAFNLSGGFAVTLYFKLS